MTDAHYLLAAAWEAGDTTPLLVLADLLDERADPDTAELLRLVAADARTARHDRSRGRRLRQLQDGIWKRVRLTAWPDMAVHGMNGAAGFSRRPDPAWPDREHLIARPDRRTVHHWLLGLDGEDEVVRTRGGAEVLRRRLPPAALDYVRRRGDLYLGAGFAAAHDYFPLAEGWPADPAAAEAEQLRRFEAAVEPALIPVTDLPAELVPFAAWVLAEYLADRPRRARAGEALPGTHLFVYREGRWHHAASLEPRDFGRAAELLRRRFGWERDRGVTAGLLVRVSDGGRVTARKLVWAGPDGAVRETGNLRATAATLGAYAFQQAAADIGADVATFVRDTEARLRDLFAAGTSAP